MSRALTDTTHLLYCSALIAYKIQNQWSARLILNWNHNYHASPMIIQTYHRCIVAFPNRHHQWCLAKFSFCFHVGFQRKQNMHHGPAQWFDNVWYTFNLKILIENIAIILNFQLKSLLKKNMEQNWKLQETTNHVRLVTIVKRLFLLTNSTHSIWKCH